MHRRQRWTIPLGIVAIGIGAVILWNRDSPETLYRQAREVFRSDAALCDELLARGIDRSGGDFPAAQVLRCRLMGRAGQWVEALGYFSTIEQPQRAPGDELIMLGGEARAAGAVVLARLAFAAASDGEGEFRQAALERLAALEQELGRLDTAREAAGRLLELDPGNAIAAFVTARIELADLNPAGAADWYERSIQTTTSPELRNSARRELIGVRLDLGDAAAARAEWNSLAASGSLSDADQLFLADLLRLEGEARAAVDLIESLPAAIRMSERALLIAGLARLDLDEPQAAVDALLRVLQYNPAHKEAHFKVGTAYRRLGNDEVAETHFARNQELTEYAVQILDLRGRLAKTPDQPELIAELARLYRLTGRNELADRLER